ncbi:MAG: hypothetical protein CW338_10690 [Clostridiales bacterium]|nr:hypothetical protein [Clostridiales bacterium]
MKIASGCSCGMGVIMRTQSEKIPDFTIESEAGTLMDSFESLKKKIAGLSAPCRLSSAPDPAEAFLRDEKDIDSILSNIPLSLSYPVPVTVTGSPVSSTLRSELEKIFKHNVWLPCGGFLTVDICEALTVFDVNSGKYTGNGKNANKSFLKLNLEAARKCAEILRLRNIGGNILIDFVDMRTDDDRAAVISAITESFRQDRAKTVIYGFTALGLLEISRKRTGPVQKYDPYPEKEDE